MLGSPLILCDHSRRSGIAVCNRGILNALQHICSISTSRSKTCNANFTALDKGLLISIPFLNSLSSKTTTPKRVDLAAIRNAIAAVRHLLQLFRLELVDPNARRKLRRLWQRLLTLGHALDHITQE